MSYPVHLTEEALQEEAVAWLYYEDQSEGLGERFLQEVEEFLAKIAEHPTYYGYSDETKTIRDVALRIFPFSIIYELKVDRIVVYHVHHAKKESK